MFKKIIPLLLISFLAACAQPAPEKPCCCKGMKPGVECPLKDKDGKEKCCCKKKQEKTQCPMKGKKPE